MITEKNYKYYYQSMKHWLDQKDTIQTYLDHQELMRSLQLTVIHFMQYNH